MLTVLDFIGNYKRAHYIPYLLAGENPESIEDHSAPARHEVSIHMVALSSLIFACSIFSKMAKNDPLRKRMADEFSRLSLLSGADRGDLTCKRFGHPYEILPPKRMAEVSRVSR